ncbi:MAG: hypothetical protein CMJ32_09170 [Phycisphaerae bacterium]|nr:hypothetical protein [Phycisphaerae bacterium]
MNRDVVIIGGGLSGLAAAIGLIRGGVRPIIIETRRKLGGRATSFIDPRTDQVLDNCQHVLMGCCTNLMDFYEHLGVLDLVQWHRTLYWADPPRPPCPMTIGRLPAPLHHALGFMRLGLFSMRQKRALARAMWRLIRMGPSGRIQWRHRTFMEFLRETGQDEDLVERFWNVVVVSACNLDVEHVGAEPAMKVFQEGFLANRFSPAMGLCTVPLIDLYDPALEMIQEGGGEVRIGTSVKSIAFDGSRVTSVITEHGTISATSVISAVPPDRLLKLVSGTLMDADSRLRRLDQIQVSPIVGVHMFFDQPVMELPHVILPGRMTHWLFNKGEDERGLQHVHAVISGAADLMDRSEQEIIDSVLADLHWAIPSSRGLKPVQARSVKERRATFAAVPGIDSIRPSTRPEHARGDGVSNLLVAGDYTDTGWPATMEGAVRSGYAAAEAITGKPTLVPDIPVGPLAWLMGLRERA